MIMEHIRCPFCNQKYDVDEEYNGTTVECVKCKQQFVIELSPLESCETPEPEDTSSSTYSDNSDDNENKILKGKINSQSINIYDDMAGAAFDYLYTAASKIIADEDNIQKKINAKSKEITNDEQKIISAKNTSRNSFISSLLCIGLLFIPDAWWLVFIAIIPFCIALNAKGDIKKYSDKKIKDQEALENLEQNFRDIRRDYKIKRLGVAYVPIATQVPFEGKSFLLDDTQSVEKKDFSLYQMNNQAEFITTIQNLKQQQQELPIIEKNDNCEEIQTTQISSSFDSVHFFDYIGQTDRELRAAGYLLGDLNKTSVSLPVIDPHGKFAAFLDEFCADSPGSQPVISVFPARTYQNELEEFNRMNEIRKMIAKENEKFEQMLRDFIKDIAAYVQTTSQLKMLSTNKIVDFSNVMLLSAFRASCNHYSPSLEESELQRLHEEDFNYHVNAADYESFILQSSSNVKFDPVSQNWVSEDGGRTNHPFGIHQIQEEVIAPLTKNLLRENRLERLKVYNNIRDQKLDYLNQWHRDTDDFYGRGRHESSDIINLMQTTLTEFNTALSQYKAFEETEKNMMRSHDLSDAVVKSKLSTMAFSVAYCEEQAKQIRMQQDEFNNYIERLKEDIDRRAEEFDYTRYYDAYLQDGHSREYIQAMFATDGLSERQRNLLEAGEFIAENAILPPEPEIADSVFGLLGTDLNTEVENALAELDQEQKISFNEDIDDDDVDDDDVDDDEEERTSCHDNK